MADGPIEENHLITLALVAAAVRTALEAAVTIAVIVLYRRAGFRAAWAGAFAVLAAALGVTARFGIFYGLVTFAEMLVIELIAFALSAVLLCVLAARRWPRSQKS